MLEVARRRAAHACLREMTSPAPALPQSGAAAPKHLYLSQTGKLCWSEEPPESQTAIPAKDFIECVGARRLCRGARRGVV